MIMDYDDDDEHYPASPRSALSSSPQQTRGLVPSPPSRRLPAPMLPVLLGDDGSIASTNHTRTSSTRSRVNSIHSQRKISLLTAATAATTLAGTAAAAATATTTAAGGATARVGGAAENNANVNTNMNTPISSRSPIVRTASPKAHRSLSPYQLPPISSNPAMINHRQHSSHPPGRAPFGSASSSPPTLDKRPPPLTGTGTGSRSSRHNAHHAHHLHYDHYDDNNTNHHQPYQPNHQNHQNHQNHHSHQSHQSRQNQHQDLHLPPIKTSIPSTRQLPPLTQIFSASSPPSKSNPIHLPPITATPNGRLPSPTLHRQPIVHPPLQHPPRPPPVRPVRSTSPPEIPPTPIKPSLLPPSQIPPPPPMPPPRPPLVAVPKLTPRHNTEPDPETLTQVLHETRAKLLAENEKAPPEVLRTVRAILDSPAWELNGHPQAAFVQPPHGPPSSSNCPSVNPNTNPNTIPNTIPNPNPNGNNSIPTANININIIANANGTVTTPAAADEISVDALQPLFKAIPYTSKGGKEGSRGGTDKYECLWGGCGKIVKRRDHMVNHVKAHLGIKPFACPFVYEYLDQRQCWMRFLRIDDLKRHVRSVHKCDLTEEGGLKPREPKPGEAMHPSTSTHAGSLLDTRAPKTPSGGIAIVATPSAITSANPRTPGPRAPPIVIPPTVVPPPSWRPNTSNSGGGGIAVPGVSRERPREKDGRSVAGVMPFPREPPMSSGSVRSDSFGIPLSLRGETPPSPMDIREDD